MSSFPRFALRVFRLGSCAGLFLALTAAVAQAQSAVVLGTVMMDGSGTPLANAEVLLTDLKLSTRSDKAGNFVLKSLPAGLHALQVRMVGFEPYTADVTLGATQTLDAEFMLKPTTTKLAKVNVRGKVDPKYAVKLADFEDRRATGIGRFLTADLFDKADGRPVSSFLRAHLPGLQIVSTGTRHWLASGRQSCGKIQGSCSCAELSCRTMEKIPPACYTKVVLNGIPVFNGDIRREEMFDIDKLNTGDIIGFEFYSDANMPLQYRGTSGETGSCGLAIIWTKGG